MCVFRTSPFRSNTHATQQHIVPEVVPDVLAWTKVSTGHVLLYQTPQSSPGACNCSARRLGFAEAVPFESSSSGSTLQPAVQCLQPVEGLWTHQLFPFLHRFTVNVTLSHCMVHLSLEFSARSEPHTPGILLSASGGSGVALWKSKGMSWVEGRMFCLSCDTERPVAKTSSSCLKKDWCDAIPDLSSSSSSDTFWSDENASENGHVHNAKNFVLCSFAHHACSPLLQGAHKKK